MNFFTTPGCILTTFCLEYKFQLLQILVLCTVVTFVHYYKFQVLHDFFHVIMVQFEIFLGVGKNCNYCCILQDNLQDMDSDAWYESSYFISSFFSYIQKKEIFKNQKNQKNQKKISIFFKFFFQFFFLRFYKNTIIEFTAKVREGETQISTLSMKKHNFECTVMMRQREATVFILALEYYCFQY